MFRYVALIFNDTDPQQVEAAQLVAHRLYAASAQWLEVLNQCGLKVFCADIHPGSLEPHVLDDDRGVVLGALFERNTDPEDDSPSRRSTLNASESANIVNSKGRSLVTDYWGNYVAFLMDAGGRRKWVIKDPTGTLPCFSTLFRGLTILFSCIEDCVKLKLLNFSINRSYLMDRVISGGREQDQNSLNEVSQIYRGECVEIDPVASTVVDRRFYWNPLTFSESDHSMEDPSQAARAVRATVRACTHTWANCHSSLLHRLSGGLDSSIISGCLKDISGRTRLTCYTYYNPHGGSDERPWARLAARHLGCEHLECAFAPADADLAAILKLHQSVEPVSSMGHLQRAAIERQLTAERHATAVFTGLGGDSGFCSDSIAFAVTDYLRRYGLRPDALRIASQVALFTELSTWTVFTRSFRRWILGSKMSDQQVGQLKGCRLVSSDLLHRLTEIKHYPHPWFSSAHRVPWSTIWRVGTLPSTPEFYDFSSASDERAPEIVSPLYSQPAIELFLLIPLHLHFQDGHDRGLARRAFTEEVPEPILRRLWKDRAPGYANELVCRNLDFLRDLFMEGVLVNEGLLDRRAVEEALSPAPTKSSVFPGEIFMHLDTEIWARKWTDPSHHLAAA